MKAYAIIIDGHTLSEQGFKNLDESSKSVGNDFRINKFRAVTPPGVPLRMENYGLLWNWPHKGIVYDEQTKMRKHAYGGQPETRVACSLSHYELWDMCAKGDEPFLILEHDAKFTKKLDIKMLDKIKDSRYGVIGLNDPRGATRLAQVFHQRVTDNPGILQDVPTIDRMEVPQGIAGASAYIIKPRAARTVIEACHEYGLWPNDAIICQQLFDFIGVTRTYYTTVQGLKSTTSGL
tara:strand:- start:22006 stop:22710 length:705 start_codon:yes stop_codon:yes gene_type:complete